MEAIRDSSVAQNFSLVTHRVDLTSSQAKTLTKRVNALTIISNPKKRIHSIPRVGLGSFSPFREPLPYRPYFSRSNSSTAGWFLFVVAPFLDSDEPQPQNLNPLFGSALLFDFFWADLICDARSMLCAASSRSAIVVTNLPWKTGIEYGFGFWEVVGRDGSGEPRAISANRGLVASSETATASIAAMSESMAYRDGMVAMTAAGDMERVLVPKSSIASGSSWSVTGRVEVRGLAACWDASIAVGETGPVTIMVGGWRGEALLDGEETVI